MKIDKRLFMQICRFKKYLFRMEYSDYGKRKADYSEINDFIYGFIIGSKVMYEGDYKAVDKHRYFFDGIENEPPELINRKAVNFYKVAVAFNKEYLVNVNDVIMFERKD